MKAEESIKHTRDVVEAIKHDLVPGTIRDCSMPPLADMKTGKTIGYEVVMQVSTKYYYGEKTLKEWKKKLGADGWNFHVSRGQLYIRFFIHEKGKKEKTQKRTEVSTLKINKP